MVIHSALTTMLVVYTLHQSISSTLPPTAYLKMIDIWLFGGLIVPFIIIVILILVDYLVMKETNQVIDMAKDNKNQWNSKSILTTMQIILPLLAGILMGSYWIIGLIHYFTWNIYHILKTFSSKNYFLNHFNNIHVKCQWLVINIFFLT